MLNPKILRVLKNVPLSEDNIERLRVMVIEDCKKKKIKFDGRKEKELNRILSELRKNAIKS